MRIDSLINNKFNDLSGNEIEIAKNILEYQELLIDMTLQEFSELIYTSKSSVIRFAQKLGFKGYSEMKNYIMWQDREEEYDNTQSMQKMLLSDISLTLNYLSSVNFDEVYDCMFYARNTYIVYTGLAQENMAAELRRFYLLLNKSIQIIPPFANSNEFKKIVDTLNEDDLIFVISLSGENKILKSTIDSLKMYKCKIISITTFDANELAGRSDYNLYANTSRSPLPKDWWIQTTSTFFIVLETLIFGYIDYLKKK